jgi:hypothetical protein
MGNRESRACRGGCAQRGAPSLPSIGKPLIVAGNARDIDLDLLRARAVFDLKACRGKLEFALTLRAPALRWSLPRFCGGRGSRRCGGRGGLFKCSFCGQRRVHDFWGLRSALRSSWIFFRDWRRQE